ncbi:hypothetical protein GCM10022254_37660 [Actinomadura meridiana]|uniref:Uncharacterized protein n=1 Tax=Actinomadura meridiana TaxID=559626 RepID=A0ABP8C5E2_9ACTN
MTPDDVLVDTWFQLAVVRVYGPWLSRGFAVPDAERGWATRRVEHARLVLALREVETSSPPYARVAFNPSEDSS